MGKRMEKYAEYARVIKLIKYIKEPCQSGLTYLFAKEAGASKPLGGSNPPGSALKFFTLKLEGPHRTNGGGLACDCKRWN